MRIEEAIQGIDGIKQIQSPASEGMGTVMIELDLGADARRVVDEVKSNIDAITTFPIETEKPIIRELTNRQQVVRHRGLRRRSPVHAEAGHGAGAGRADRDPGPSRRSDIVSAPPYEISIEVSEDDLRRHGMTFDQVADAVRRSSLDLPGGSVRTERGEILLRTIGQAYRGAEFEDLVLWTRADGSRLRLGDVATVVDGFEETDQEAWFDVEPRMMVSVFRTGDQSAIDIAALATEYVAEAQARLPEGVLLTVWQNEAESLNNELSLMLQRPAPHSTTLGTRPGPQRKSRQRSQAEVRTAKGEARAGVETKPETHGVERRQGVRRRAERPERKPPKSWRNAFLKSGGSAEVEPTATEEAGR